MIDQILSEFAKSDFDFRQFANPNDPLSSLFEDWVNYYRLKFAIARILQPRSILEIGVRYGYSAATFLRAAPKASYLGIDAENESFGGEEGALDWARKITAGYDVSFLVADSQRMSRLPGSIYDLIHIDGQQDGGGTFHDLRHAVSQARWILLDGYFWTQENFVNANDFLRKFRNVIDFSISIPGYAGELLIRVSDAYLSSTPSSLSNDPSESSQIVDSYDSHYYLNDCGGYEDFRASRGRSINDSRLLSLLALARLAPGPVCLDAGCGRGEMTYQLALGGFRVTAIDYSSASIELAQSCFQDAERELRERVEFQRGDVSHFQSDRKFDLVLAGDLIEHLSAEELDRFYAVVASLLSARGFFALHTAPSSWFYNRDYPRRRKEVEQLGGSMPAEPRTRYELLMHINEQSPARLRRQLLQAFPFVKVWVARSDMPVGNLSRKFEIPELVACREIYAVASSAPIDLGAIRSALTSSIVAPGQHGEISIQVQQWPKVVGTGERFTLGVVLAHRGDQGISSLPPHPVLVSYHWCTLSGKVVIFEGLRTSIPLGLAPGESRKVYAAILAPSVPGRFMLRMTLVQEGRFWFEQESSFESRDSPIEVR